MAADDTQQQLEELARLSVQTPAQPYRAAQVATLAYRGEYAHFLPPLGDERRQALLRAISTHPQNSMWMGAVSGILKQFISTPYEIKGKRKIKHYQGILLNAQMGAGWEAFAQVLLWDYFNCDEGACVQLVGPGDVDAPLSRELILGMTVLDTYRCYYTGNWEYPVFYQDAITGELHRLHWTRVIRFVDNPLADPYYRGGGLCALSRAVTYVQQNIAQNTYVGGMLDNTPPVGFTLVSGIVPKQWDDAWQKYNATRRSGASSGYAPIADIVTLGDTKPSVEFIRFSQAPEGFDAEKYEQMQAVGIARALNIDPQDVMPISGGSFGTNTQARVLDKKAAGKMLANLYAMIERAFNTRLMPDPLTFTFKPKDSEKNIADAEVTQKHLLNAQIMVSIGMPREAVARYLASTDPTLQDILLDPDGELIYAYDTDVTADVPAMPDVEMTVTDIDNTTPLDAPIVGDGTKAFSAAPFRRAFAPVIERLNAGEAGKRAAAAIIKPLLYEQGLQAFVRGLADNGVTTVGSLKEEDKHEYEAWVRETREYVDNMIASFFGENALHLSPKGIADKVEMWVNKSLRDAYYRGLARGARDPLMLWEYGSTEHCRDCRNYNQQVHRLSVWKETAMPGSSRLECGGFRCKCKLTKTSRKPSPNPPQRPTYFGRKSLWRNCSDTMRWELPEEMEEYGRPAISAS